MGLNNKGWGLGTFLIYICMFLGILILLAILISNFTEDRFNSENDICLDKIENII